MTGQALYELAMDILALRFPDGDIPVSCEDIYNMVVDIWHNRCHNRRIHVLSMQTLTLKHIIKENSIFI